MYVCVCMCMCVCMYVCVFMYICLCVCMYVCVYACIFIYIYSACSITLSNTTCTGGFLHCHLRTSNNSYFSRYKLVILSARSL